MSVERILGEKLAAAEREVERLRGVCEDWGRNYQSWVDATRAAEARADAAERKVAAVEALADEWERSARYLDSPRGALRGRADQNYSDATDLRGALDTAADPDTHTPSRWESS